MLLFPIFNPKCPLLAMSSQTLYSNIWWIIGNRFCTDIPERFKSAESITQFIYCLSNSAITASMTSAQRKKHIRHSTPRQPDNPQIIILAATEYHKWLLWNEYRKYRQHQPSTARVVKTGWLWCCLYINTVTPDDNRLQYSVPSWFQSVNVFCGSDVKACMASILSVVWRIFMTVTGQLADTPTRALDISRTGHLAEWSTHGLDN